MSPMGLVAWGALGLEGPSNPWAYFGLGGVVVAVVIIKQATKAPKLPLRARRLAAALDSEGT